MAKIYDSFLLQHDCTLYIVLQGVHLSALQLVEEPVGPLLLLD